jgi:ribA/ribD-fused uncharacterized protein
MIKKFQGRYFFMSNFYPVEIEHNGIKYPTVEAYYVAMKADKMQFLNGTYYTLDDFREMVASLKEPAFAKKIGKMISVRKDWDDIKFDIMKWGINEKFKDEKLKEDLLATRDLEIIESNVWHDNYWGSCDCNKCKSKGKNHLGKLLMEVRDELRGVKKTGLEDILK